MKMLRSLVQLTRIYMALVLGFSALIGVRLAHVALPTDVMVSIYFAQFCIAAGGFAMNDVLDRRRDVGVPSKPIPTGRVSVTVAALTSVALSVLGVVIAGSVSIPLSIFSMGQVTLVWFYSAIKLHSGTAANWLTAALCASGFLYGSVKVGVLGFVWIPVALTIEIILARELVKDVLDMETDRLAGVMTVPINKGLTRTHYAVAVLLGLALCTVGILPLAVGGLNHKSLVVLSIVILALLSLLSRFPLFANPRRNAGLFLNVSAAGFLVALGALWNLVP